MEDEVGIRYGFTIVIYMFDVFKMILKNPK